MMACRMKSNTWAGTTASKQERVWGLSGTLLGFRRTTRAMSRPLSAMFAFALTLAACDASNARDDGVAMCTTWAKMVHSSLRADDESLGSPVERRGHCTAAEDRIISTCSLYGRTSPGPAVTPRQVTVAPAGASLGGTGRRAASRAPATSPLMRGAPRQTLNPITKNTQIPTLAWDTNTPTRFGCRANSHPQKRPAGTVSMAITKPMWRWVTPKSRAATTIAI